MALASVASKYNALRNKRNKTILLTDEQFSVKEKCESSFYEFVVHAWQTLENREFIPGWHVNALCDHLEATYRGDIRKLIINLPPRTGKSNILSVLFPAWCWIKNPGLRFLYTAYAQILSVRDSVGSRRLITSHWYQSLWGDRFSLMGDVNNKLKFDNDKTGSRIASSAGGANTGLGGDFIICDDPNSVTTSESEVSRANINNWWDYVMSTRVSNFKTARWIVAQQRTHSLDLSGHILAKNLKEWVHLCLPMEFEVGRKCKTIVLSPNGKPWIDPRKKDGELLWPNGIGTKELTALKADFNYDSYRISGQLQQRPSPASGGIIQKDWFKWWKEKEYPEFDYILQSWDTALTSGVHSCYSACTTWGVFDQNGIKNIMLLSVLREKLEYPELRKMAVRLYNNYEDTMIDEPIVGNNKPHHILIEQKVSGYSLLQDLMKANIPVLKFNPNKHGDKIGRCRLVTNLMENGLVWLPTFLPNCEYLTEDAQMFLEAAALFPNDESNDIIDSTSQALIRLTSSGWVDNKEDPRDMPQEIWKKNKPYY